MGCHGASCTLSLMFRVRPGCILVGLAVFGFSVFGTVAALKRKSLWLKVYGVLNLIGVVLCLTGVVRSMQLAGTADKVCW